jgi:hypothetical protein
VILGCEARKVRVFKGVSTLFLSSLLIADFTGPQSRPPVFGEKKRNFWKSAFSKLYSLSVTIFTLGFRLFLILLQINY